MNGSVPRAAAVIVVATLLVTGAAAVGVARADGVALDGGVDGPVTPGSATVVDECTTITEPGRYVLGHDLTNVSATEDTGIPAGGTNVTACVVVRSSDVTLDGVGHAVDGKGFEDLDADDVGDDEPFDDAETATFPSGVVVRAADGATLSNVTVRNVTTTDWFLGVLADNVTGLTLRDATASDNANLGVELLGVTDGTVENVTANGNPFAGLYMATGGNTTVANSTMVDNGLFGVDLFFRSDGNHFVNNTVRGSAVAGIVVVQSADTTLESNTLTDTAGDESLFGFSGGVALVGTENTSLRGTTMTDNDRWDLYTVGCGDVPGVCFTDDDVPGPGFTLPNSTPVSAEGLALGNATVSLTGEDVALDAASPPAAPPDRRTVGGGVTLAGVGTNASATLGVGYEEGAFDESAVVLSRHGADGWSDLPSTVDADANVVSASPTGLADSAVYAPLAPAEADGNVVSYQVDFAAGQPIENLSADRLYAGQDRLFRFAFGNSTAGITDRGSAWASERLRECVDYGHIVSHNDGDTAQVGFTVAEHCSDVTLSLAVYSMPGETFDVDTVDQQELLNSTTGTYGPGEHTITVDLPDSDEADG